MYHINDLKILQDILPFFDYTIHSYTKSYLLKLMTQNALQPEDIKAQQHLIQWLIRKENLVMNYNYSGVYFKESYLFTEHLEGIDSINFHWSKSYRLILENKALRILIFLKKIDELFADEFDESAPLLFQQFDTKLKELVNQLNVYRYTELSLDNRLGKNKIKTMYEKILIAQTEILNFFQQLIEVETYISIAKSAIIHQLSIPLITKDIIELEQFYHPKIENAVKNDFTTTKNVIVLTGANMSGKSTFFKSIALCIYLGNIGFPIPATSGKVPSYSCINVKINHQDDLENGYSHFMNEVMNVKEYLEFLQQSKPAVSFYDELFNGTNSTDATELLHKVVNGLHKYPHSLTFISTHIHALNTPFEQMEHVETYHIHCDISNEIPHYTYLLKKGTNDLKIGQYIFKNMGVEKYL